jgi:predicted DNA-binding transcriptional regulator AlpA|tara:strand:+ start:129742 stop:129969 length:228 start_codon:yes stop_codon:yes gene_type:complete
MIYMTRAKPGDSEILSEVPDDVKLLDARNVGKILGISESKVRLLTDAGALTPVRIGMRSLRYRLSDIYEYSRSLK